MIKIKRSEFVERRLVKVNAVLSFIALIGFILNITVVDIYEIVISYEFWLTIPKTFLFTMPLLEFVFVYASQRQEAIRKMNWALKGLGVMIIAIWCFMYFIFDVETIALALDWWLGNVGYKSALLGFIALLALGFMKIQGKNFAISFYFNESGGRYRIGGLLFELRNSYISIGAPNINFPIMDAQ